jgi:hypothetical protein
MTDRTEDILSSIKARRSVLAASESEIDGDHSTT